MFAQHDLPLSLTWLTDISVYSGVMDIPAYNDLQLSLPNMWYGYLCLSRVAVISACLETCIDFLPAKIDPLHIAYITFSGKVKIDLFQSVWSFGSMISCDQYISQTSRRQLECELLNQNVNYASPNTSQPNGGHDRSNNHHELKSQIISSLVSVIKYDSSSRLTLYTKIIAQFVTWKKILLSGIHDWLFLGAGKIFRTSHSPKICS